VVEWTSDGSFRYRPSIGYVGSDLFAYRVIDQAGLSSEATVSIQVTDTAPRIVESSINDGDSRALGPMVVSFRFDQAIDESFIDLGNVVLVGSSGLSYSPRSIIYHPESWTITAEFTVLPVDAYRLIVRSGTDGIHDLSGLALDGESGQGQSLPTGDGQAGGDFTIEFSVTSPIQQITGSMDRIEVNIGDSFSMPVVLSTSDANPAQGGVALRLHFDSSFLRFDKAVNIFAEGLIAEPVVLLDTDDLDADPRTDRFVLIAWDSPIGDEWPGTEEPLQLFTANFTVVGDQPSGLPSQLRFSGDAANGYEFASTPIDVVLADSRFRAGDANRDFVFNQLDVVQVLTRGKYQSQSKAEWADGDWNGDGVFDQLDIVAALQTGHYLQGPYTAAADPHALVDVALLESETNW
jgi:hypothetical protein